MRLCLLLCILCLVAPGGCSQPPYPSGPAGERESPGKPGVGGFQEQYGPARAMGPPGPSGPRGFPGSPGPRGTPGPAIMCGRDLLEPVYEDLDDLKKRLYKLDLAVNYDFVRKVDQKYFVSNKERGSFSRAVEFCSQQGLELVLPKNEKENSALTQLVGEVDKVVWINVNKADGNFESDMENRPLTFTKWGEGQPDKSVGDTGCTMLSENSVWRVSHDCSLNAYIICQI